MEKTKFSFRKLFQSGAFKSIASAILCALIGIFVGYIILLIINAPHASKAMGNILKSFMYYNNSVKRVQYFGSILVKTVPLILCALSVLFAYKSGLFNIGAGGQYCIGIGVSLWCALSWHLPWILCVLLAALASAIWGAISGALKAFFNINEVIACIMMNWISLYLVNIMMAQEKIMDTTKSETFSLATSSPQSMLPKLGLNNLFNNQYVTIAVPLTIIIAIIIMIVLNKTTFGYELKATGLNKNAAKYAGMKDKANIIITMAIAGALAGLAASFFYLTDMEHWKTSSTVPGMGFSGIAVAFLGGLNPIGVIFAGYFIQHITFGGSLIDMHYYNPQIADLISSIIIYTCAFVLFFKDVISRLAAKNSDSKNVNAEDNSLPKSEAVKEANQ